MLYGDKIEIDAMMLGFTQQEFHMQMVRECNKYINDNDDRYCLFFFIGYCILFVPVFAFVFCFICLCTQIYIQVNQEMRECFFFLFYA